MAFAIVIPGRPSGQDWVILYAAICFWYDNGDNGDNGDGDDCDDCDACIYGADAIIYLHGRPEALAPRGKSGGLKVVLSFSLLTPPLHIHHTR